MSEDRLLKIFDNINDLQKFAEAKNGAIIVLNSSIILGIIGIFGSKYNQFPILLKIYFDQMLLFFLASIVICLLSLVPRFTYKRNKQKNVKNENYIYFMNLADYKVKQFLFELNNYEKKKKNSKFEKYIAKQAIINAGITRIKFQMSKIAIICTLAAIFTPFIIYPIYFFSLQKQNEHH